MTANNDATAGVELWGSTAGREHLRERVAERERALSQQRRAEGENLAIETLHDRLLDPEWTYDLLPDDRFALVQRVREALALPADAAVMSAPSDDAGASAGAGSDDDDAGVNALLDQTIGALNAGTDSGSGAVAPANANNQTGKASAAATAPAAPAAQPAQPAQPARPRNPTVDWSELHAAQAQQREEKRPYAERGRGQSAARATPRAREGASSQTAARIKAAPAQRQRTAVRSAPRREPIAPVAWMDVIGFSLAAIVILGTAWYLAPRLGYARPALLDATPPAVLAGVGVYLAALAGLVTWRVWRTARAGRPGGYLVPIQIEWIFGLAVGGLLAGLAISPWAYVLAEYTYAIVIGLLAAPAVQIWMLPTPRAWTATAPAWGAIFGVVLGTAVGLAAWLAVLGAWIGHDGGGLDLTISYARVTVWFASPFHGLPAGVSEAAARSIAWFAAWLPCLVLPAAAIGGILGYGVGTPYSSERTRQHLRGPRRHAGGAGIAYLAQTLAGERRGRRDTPGDRLAIAPGVYLTHDRETRGILVFGSIGSGKTVWNKYVIDQLIHQGYRVLIHDYKGDFTSELDCKFTLLSPTDARSATWDICEETGRTSEPAIRQLAADLVPEGEGQERGWRERARTLLRGCIYVAIARRGARRWHWSTVAAVLDDLAIDLPRVRCELAAVDREAAGQIHVDDNGSPINPTPSVISNLTEAREAIDVLRKAETAGARWSAARWLSDNTRARRGLPAVTVIRGDPAMPRVTQAWMPAAVGAIQRRLMALPDSKSRKIALVFDELPTMGYINNLGELVRTGRSKGVRTILSAQDQFALKDAYGEKEIDSILSNAGIKLIFQARSGPDAENLSELIGEREVRYPRDSQEHGERRTWGDRESVRTVQADELTTDLAPTRRGVRGLVVGVGRDVADILVPYARRWRERRAAHKPAEWMKGSHDVG